MLLQFDLKHIHKVNFYPSDNNFTQALLVLLVTNMISVYIPHICHGHTDGVRGEKICHVEKFQISVHETCGES